MKALHHTTNRHSRAHAKSGRTAALVLAALTGSACDAVLHPAVQNTHNSYGDEEHIVIPEDIADAANVLPNDTPNLPGYHRAQILVSIDAADNPSSNVDETASSFSINSSASAWCSFFTLAVDLNIFCRTPRSSLPNNSLKIFI